jgi:hypothetical protein
MPRYPSNFNGPSLSVNNITANRELKDTTGANSASGLRYPTDINVAGTGNISKATQTWADFFLALTKLNRDVTAALKWLLVPVQACDYATQAVLPNSPTYSNGTAGVLATLTATGGNANLLVDGVTLSTLGARILVKDEADAENNGIYVLTSVTTNWVLTRVREADIASSTEMCWGTLVNVLSGTSAGKTYIQTTSAAITMGTTELVFEEFTQESQLPTSKGNLVAREIDFIQVQNQRKLYDLTGKAMNFVKELGFLAAHVGVFTDTSGDQVGAAVTSPAYPSAQNRGW